MNDPIQFDPNDFNKKYSELDLVNKQNMKIIEQKELNKLNRKMIESQTTKLDTGVSITIDIINVFVKSLNLLLQGKNPIPFLFQNDRNILGTSIIFLPAIKSDV